MDEREILQNILKSSKESLDFYSNSGKPERERSVVSELLKLLEISFEESELKSPEQESKIDVSFRDAMFQVKELMDSGYLRNKFIKETYNSIKTANRIEEITYPSIPFDIPPAAKIYDLVLENASELSKEVKYLAHKSSLDLVIYVTRTRASLIQEAEVDIGDFSGLGWRSVICVNPKQAVVLYASSYAPKFIQKNGQKIHWCSS